MSTTALPLPSFLANVPIELPPSPYNYLLSFFLTLLIISEATYFYPGSGIFKLLSSLCFLVGGLVRPTTPPLLILGLFLSLIGDALLIPSRTHYFSPATAGKGLTLRFQLGALSFALAHVAYTATFVNSPDPALGGVFQWPKFWRVLIPGMVMAAGIAAAVKREERPLVVGYAAVITSMVGTAAATGGGQRLVGAIMFLISDLFVAADTFDGDKDKAGTKAVKENPKGKRKGGRDGWPARAVGWLLYFWAQMVLAGCI